MKTRIHRSRAAIFGWLTGLMFCGTAWASAAAQAVNAAPPAPAARVPQTQLGIAQQPNENLDWMLDGKFGMFIHWGLYSGPGKGEWMMENTGMLPEKYRQFAFPESGDNYFDAASYHPEAWAALARDAGMKWMCLTARHHDGFCLFDSPYPTAFTSMQTLKRDLVAEYVKACRAAGLKVGIYYSPLSWRYPGYYDVTGTNCLPNKFGYKTDPAHMENARVMKEENYANVKKLLTGYGRIDLIFWDGGWLGQRGSDADGAYFHEPGRYLDPANRWPIKPEYRDKEEGTGKALGIMGMVRKYQPDVITNPRYGWMGDIVDQEGSFETTGKMRTSAICEKCLSMNGDGSWGYNAPLYASGRVTTRDQLVRYLANCVVRNMVLLVNVSPDRHGVIPELQQQRLREVGAWMAKMGESIYGTRSGPWEPADRRYGYCYKGSTIYVHILKEYPGDTFKFPPLGNFKAVKAYQVYDGKPLAFAGNDDGGVTVRGFDRTVSPADSVIAVSFDHEIQSAWKK